MALTLERIEALAPDQSSLAAARKLLKPAGWPTLAVGEGLAWGECQGSGATPYRVVISEADHGYKCTCPSRKFPCKHSPALMWLRAEAKVPSPRRRFPSESRTDSVAAEELIPLPTNLRMTVRPGPNPPSTSSKKSQLQPMTPTSTPKPLPFASATASTGKHRSSPVSTTSTSGLLIKSTEA
jgi:hypothetical protein